MMNIDEVTNMSLDMFREKSSGKKVVLLYPWTNYRNLFLTHFLHDTSRDFLYYRIEEDHSQLEMWLGELVRGLDETLEGFGDNLKAALELRRPEPDELGEAFAADLKALSKKPYALFIDELDRVPLDQDFKNFIRAVVDNIPKSVQLVFSSRLLTYQPWYDMVERGDAVVLGTERRKDDVMFRVEDVSKPRLEVYALGRGHVLANGQPITNWDGALPRNLFFYFMDNHLVTRNDIFEVFWPNLPVKEATNVFHVTKRKISERIGLKIDEEGSYELTQYSGGFYTPSDKLIRHYDAADFQLAVEQGMLESDDERAEELFLQAVELYRAPFLQTVDMSWVSERRKALRDLFAQALIGLGRIQKRRNNDMEAISYFIRALRQVPTREDVHREVMLLYIQNKMYDDAREQYTRLANELDSILGIGPSRETKDLLDVIDAES